MHFRRCWQLHLRLQPDIVRWESWAGLQAGGVIHIWSFFLAMYYKDIIPRCLVGRLQVKILILFYVLILLTIARGTRRSTLVHCFAQKEMVEGMRWMVRKIFQSKNPSGTWNGSGSSPGIWIQIQRMWMAHISLEEIKNLKEKNLNYSSISKTALRVCQRAWNWSLSATSFIFRSFFLKTTVYHFNKISQLPSKIFTI